MSGRSVHARSSPITLEQTIYPIEWSWSESQVYNFDIHWKNIDSIRTSYRGYSTVVYVSDYYWAQSVVQGWPVTIWSVTFQTFLVSLSANSILLVFRLTNSDSNPITASVAVYIDTIVGNNEEHWLVSLPNGQGVAWGDEFNGSEYSLNIIGRHSPLVTDITAYWWAATSSYYNFIWSTTDSLNAWGSDATVGFSWQGISIPGNGSKCISVIFRSGNHSYDQPTIDDIQVLDLSSTSVPIHGSFTINISISNRFSMNVFVVPDGHHSGITLLASNKSSGFYIIKVDISEFLFSLGVHNLSFYVVNDIGFVSEALTLSLEVIIDATATASHTPTMTQSPIQSQSPEPYPSAYPTTVPIVWYWAGYYPHNFEIWWRVDYDILQTVWGGYDTILQVGDELEFSPPGGPLKVGNVTIDTGLVSLSAYTILVIFRLMNSNSEVTFANVSLSGDCTVDTNDFHYIGALPKSQGIFWTGVVSREEYLMNIICRNYPLVSDVSAYWFGSLDESYYNYWSQTDSTLLIGWDWAFSVSWQNIEIQPNDHKCCSAIFRSGNHLMDQPFISLRAVGSNSTSVPVHGNLEIAITIMDAVPTSVLSVFLVVDEYVFGIICLARNLSSGTYNFLLDIGYFSLSIGTHGLAFYAVNDVGFVSDPLLLLFEVLPDATSTASHSPTLTSSPLASQSPAPFPSPYPTCYPIVFTWSVYDSYNFDIKWRTSMMDVATAFRGYDTVLRVDEYQSDVDRGRPVTLQSITLETFNISLSPFTILLVFKLTNADSNPTICDVAVWVDTIVGTVERHYIGALPHNQGVKWSGVNMDHELIINVIGRDYPLVSDITTFWYGPWSSVSGSYWNQTDLPSIEDSDVAMAFSWQRISVIGSGSRSLSVIFRSGDHFLDKPNLVLDAPESVTLPLGSPFSIRINVSDQSPNSVMNIYIVINSDVAGIILLASNLTSGSYTFAIDSYLRTLSVGFHDIVFVAVNDVGFVSDPRVFWIEMVPGATPTIRQSPTATRSPLRSQSRDPNPSPLPTSYPIVWAYGPFYNSNFNIQWRNGNNYIGTAYLGYRTVFRVGNSTTLVAQGQPVNLSSITLQTVLVSLSQYSILLVFRLTNRNSDAIFCDIAVNGSSWIGQSGMHHAGALSNNQGFYWSGTLSRAEYVINVLGRQYPLVSDITAYWFGPPASLQENFWNQTTLLSMDAVDISFVFSWQGISVPGNGMECVSVIFRSGNHFSNQPLIGPVSVPGFSLLIFPVSSVINVSIPIFDTMPGSVLSVYVVVDGHACNIVLLATNLLSGSFFGSVDLSPFQLSVGPHVLVFYVVNDLGFVSNPSNLAFEVIPDPTPTATHTPTLTQVPDPFPSRTPHPLPYPIIWLWASAAGANFDIKWQNTLNYSSTFSGYHTVLRVNGASGNVSKGAPITISSITLRTVLVPLSSYTILLVFKLTNTDPTPVTCDVNVWADTMVASNDSHHAAPLPNDQGVYWDGEYRGAQYRLNVIGRYYPLVTWLTAYWLGPFREMPPNYWNQSNITSIAGIDVGISLSWQEISVPGSSFATLSALFRSGDHYDDQPVIDKVEVLNLDPDAIPLNRTFFVQVLISDAIPISKLSIFVVVDNDVFGVLQVASDLSSGSRPFQLDLKKWSLSLGSHTLSFYAVNDLGFVSIPANLAITVVNWTEPLTETPIETPLSTETPTTDHVEPVSNKSGHLGLIIGIAVGCTGIVIAVIVVVICLFRNKYRVPGKMSKSLTESLGSSGASYGGKIENAF